MDAEVDRDTDGTRAKVCTSRACWRRLPPAAALCLSSARLSCLPVARGTGNALAMNAAGNSPEKRERVVCGLLFRAGDVRLGLSECWKPPGVGSGTGESSLGLARWSNFCLRHVDLKQSGTMVTLGYPLPVWRPG